MMMCYIFQEEACRMAWKLLTEVYQLSPSLLYVTYFKGNEELGLEADLEVKHIWRSIGCVARDNLGFVFIMCKGMSIWAVYMARRHQVSDFT